MGSAGGAPRRGCYIIRHEPTFRRGNECRLNVPGAARPPGPRDNLSTRATGSVTS